MVTILRVLVRHEYRFFEPLMSFLNEETLLRPSGLSPPLPCLGLLIADRSAFPLIGRRVAPRVRTVLGFCHGCRRADERRPYNLYQSPPGFSHFVGSLLADA